MKKVNITGVGASHPVTILNNNDIAKMVDTTDEWIKQKIGISERRIAKSETVIEMGVEAAKKAIIMSGCKISDIDVVICASISFETKIPTLSNHISHELGIHEKMCFDINAGGCNNLLSGIIIAANFIRTGSAKKVLVISSDRNSDFINWKDRTTCVFFGDGASAVVLEEVENDILFMDLKGEKNDALLLPTAQIKGADDSFLKMDGRAIFSFATQKVVEWIKESFDKNNIKPEEIDRFVFHQANLNIIKKIMEELNVSMDKTTTTISKYGNTTGASIGMVLEEDIYAGNLKKGDRIAIVTFGGGLNWGIVVLDWCI